MIWSRNEIMSVFQTRSLRLFLFVVQALGQPMAEMIGNGERGASTLRISQS